jgi:addiction module HigA family antidote
MSAAGLARQIDVPVNRITGIINGQRAITADTALRLGHWFGTSPEFWLNLQRLYELRLARARLATVWINFPSSGNASASRRPNLRYGPIATRGGSIRNFFDQ